MNTDNSKANDPIERFDIAVLAAVLAIFVFAVYANSIGGKFVWDDRTIIVRNAAIRSFDNTAYIFKNEFGEDVKYRGNIYRPLQELSYMADHYLYGLDARGYHITNVLLQSACTIALFLMLISVTGSGTIAFFSALVFAAHPVNTEAIAYISGRSDPMCLFFLLCSFICYIKSRNSDRRNIVPTYTTASLILFTLSLLSREIALVFPLILIAHEIINARSSWRKYIMNIIPFFMIAASYIVLRMRFISMDIARSYAISLNTMLWTDVNIIAEYLRLIVLPVGLHMERSIRLANGPADPAVMPAILALSALALVFIYVYLRRRKLFFWCIWFAVFLFPHLYFKRLNALLAEHWIYAAAIAFYVLAMSIYFDITSRFKISPLIKYSIPTILIACLFFLTVARNADWADEPSIYNNTLKYSRSAKALLNLGVYYYMCGDYGRSLKAYEEAMEINPFDPLCHNNMALLFKKIGDIKSAARHWKRSLQLDKDQPDIVDKLKECGILKY